MLCISGQDKLDPGTIHTTSCDIYMFISEKNPEHHYDRAVLNLKITLSHLKTYF